MDGKFNETSPYKPNSPYSASKAASDHFVRAWNKTFHLPTIITNCSNNFGPGQFPEKLIPLVINKAINKLPIPVYGNGKNIRDWLYVEDHIDALLLSCTYGKGGMNYCIGGNNEIRNIDLVKEICKILDKYLESDYLCSDLIRLVKDRPGHDLRYSINSSLISRNLAGNNTIS